MDVCLYKKENVKGKITASSERIQNVMCRKEETCLVTHTNGKKKVRSFLRQNNTNFVVHKMYLNKNCCKFLNKSFMYKR